MAPALGPQTVPAERNDSHYFPLSLLFPGSVTTLLLDTECKPQEGRAVAFTAVLSEPEACWLNALPAKPTTLPPIARRGVLAVTRWTECISPSDFLISFRLSSQTSALVTWSHAWFP